MPRLPIEISYYHPHIERLSREELLGLQWRRLKLLLEYAYYKNPFHRRRFQEAKLTPEDTKTMEDFRRLPIMDKPDMIRSQNESPPFGSIAGVGEKKIARVYMTSGTSGKGQEVHCLTQADLEYSSIGARGYHWHGIRRGDVVINFMPTSLSPLAGPDSLQELMNRMGVTAIHLGITYNTEQKLQLVKRFSPHYGMGTAGRRLRLIAEQQGINPRRDLPRYKGFLGDVLTGSTPEGIREDEEFWNTRSYGIFGSTQGRTYIGHTCEYGNLHNGRLGMYHMHEDYLLCEYLDKETREPVPPGGEGELVLTPLLLEASPLIRFGMNDRVIYQPHNYCPCGRPFAGILMGSVRRYDDMMKIRVVNVWPSAVDGVIFSHPEMAEYQARVWVTPDGREEVTIKVEFKEGVSPERKQELLATIPGELRDHIGLRMEVEETDKPLPRFEWKPVRWTDERKKERLERRIF